MKYTYQVVIKINEDIFKDSDVIENYNIHSIDDYISSTLQSNFEYDNIGVELISCKKILHKDDK